MILLTVISRCAREGITSDVPSLYEPINLYKPLAPGIGIVDGPFERLTVAGLRLPLPFTTRMTVVRLNSGDLFLHSPIAFDAALARHLQAMGRIRHLVSPNQFHYAHIGEWSRAFSEAITWASTGARQRARARRNDVQFKMDLGSAPAPEWRDDIDQTAIPGGIFGEIVFFHKASKTLIVTDTTINLELDKIGQPWRLATRITGMYYPRGQIFFGMRFQPGTGSSGRCSWSFARVDNAIALDHHLPDMRTRLRRCQPTPASFSTTARVAVHALNPRLGIAASIALMVLCHARWSSKTASAADRGSFG